MIPWWQRRMCALDLETTGVDPLEARIVTATVAFVGGGQATDGLFLLVDPGVEIPEEVTAIHGVSTEHARQHGITPAEALPRVLEALSGASRAGFPLVVFNAPYDLTVLDRECLRHGVAAPPAMLVVDPFVIDGHIDRYRSGSRRLEATCKAVGATLEGAHDSTSDAIAAARLAWVIGKRGRIIRRAPRSEAEGLETRALHEEWARVRDDLPALHEAQRGWFATRAAELEEYLRGGDPKKDVPPQPDRVVPRNWPMIPRPGEAPIGDAEASESKAASG